MVTHENGGGHGQHQPPSGFIRKYIFSIDHKVIGIQYLSLALFSVFLGMALVAPDALASGVAERALVLLQGRPDDAGAISGADDHARHDHGLHGADHGAAIGIRQLFPAHSDWRGGHGVPGPEHAFVLDDVRFPDGDGRRVFCGGRRADRRLDLVSAVERAGRNCRSRARRGRDAVDCRTGDLLRRVADGRAELHYHADRSSREGHDARAACRLRAGPGSSPRSLACWRSASFWRRASCSCSIALPARASSFPAAWWSPIK